MPGQLFLERYQCRWPTRSCGSHGPSRCARTAFSFLHHTKPQLLVGTGMAPPGTIHPQHLAGIWSLLPNKQQSSPSAFFAFLHAIHLTGKWGLLAIPARYPLFSSQIKSLFSMMLPKKGKKKIIPNFMFHFIKAASLLSFYRKYFKRLVWSNSSAWDKMLRTQKILLYYFNLENLGRHFPLGWLEQLTPRIFLYFPSKTTHYSHTLFQRRGFCNSRKQYFYWRHEMCTALSPFIAEH